MEQTKECTKCKILLPSTNEYFWVQKSRNGQLAAICKICDREKGKIYRDNNKEKIKQKSHNYSQREEVKEKNRFKVQKFRNENPVKNSWYTYISHARQYNREFSINFEEFEKLIKSSCHYCGVKNLKLNGLDRLDSSKGYNFNNVVPCCFSCNNAKSDKTYNEFLQMCANITVHLNLLEKEHTNG